jgi:hypothetical protein
VFFAAVTLAICWLGKGGPDIPHPVGGTHAACTSCHSSDRLPDGHKGRVEDSCRSCHSEASGVTGERGDGPGEVRLGGVDDSMAGGESLVRPEPGATLPRQG